MTAASTCPVVQLKELCERITKGSTPTSYGFAYQSHGIRFVKAENIDEKGVVSSTTDYIDEKTNDFLKRSILKENDVLFSIAGTIGRVGLIGKRDLPANTNQALAIIRLLPGGINPRYLFYYLKSNAVHSTVKKQTVGVGRANVSLANLGEVEVPIATPDEQKCIVAEIEKQFSRLDEAVASLKRTKANLKRYKAAVLKAAVEGKLTEDWRKQHPNVEPASKLLERIAAERRARCASEGKPDLDDLVALPVGWEWCITDALFSFVTSGSRGWARYYSQEGPLFLRVGNLDHDSIRLDLKNIQRVKPPKGAEGTRTKVETGDILVSITADVGMTALAPQGIEEAYINQHIALARPVPEMCREYLAWYLATPDGGQKQFRRLQRGATKAGLGLDDIRAIPVPIPPLAEQQQIVAEVERRLSVIDELEAAVGANLTRADRLREAILKEAFKGDLIRQESYTGS